MSDAAWHTKKWRDGSPVKPRQAKTLSATGCLSAPAQRKLSAYNRKNREAFYAFRELRQVTPYNCGRHGRFAIPCYIVDRESDYRCTADNPASTAWGFYQLLDTWWGHLGRRPTCREQHFIAADLWDGGAGASNWALTL